jgi:cyanophycinase
MRRFAPSSQSFAHHLRVASLALLAAVAILTAPASASDKKSGSVVALGGAIRHDNVALWSQLVQLSGGTGSEWVVVPAASGDPEKSAQSVITTLEAAGAKATMLPLSSKLKDFNAARAVADARLIRMVDQASGIYFTGGAQERITTLLLDKEGKRTPLLDAIWRVLERGGVVAGSSAGAAIMSETMFREPLGVLETMQQGAVRGSHIDRGLGFAGSSVFVDQHFVARGRLGRMLSVMVQEGIALGVGVEENSAALFRDGQVEVLSGRGVIVVDLTTAMRRSVRPLMLSGASVSWLETGDTFALATRTPSASAAKRAAKKLDWRANDFAPYNTSVRFYPDMLGDGVVVQAMTGLVDSRATEARGLAFGLPSARQEVSRLGFAFRFYKRDDTLGYFSTKGGAEQYTVLNLGLDVLPVTMASPLYLPYPATVAPVQERAAPPTGDKPAKAGENAGLRR